jgi:hypothetical protein
MPRIHLGLLWENRRLMRQMLKLLFGTCLTLLLGERRVESYPGTRIFPRFQPKTTEIGGAFVAVAILVAVGRGRSSWGIATIRDRLGRGFFKGVSTYRREKDQSRIIG